MRKHAKTPLQGALATVQEHVGELPVPAIPFAEPIVNYIMYDRKTERTGQTRPPVSVYEMKPG